MTAGGGRFRQTAVNYVGGSARRIVVGREQRWIPLVAASGSEFCRLQVPDDFVGSRRRFFSLVKGGAGGDWFWQAAVD